MAEQNFDLPPGTDSVSTMRAKLVDAAKALRACFWGTSEPGASIRDKFMFWADTTASLFKQRNSDDTAWLPLWDPSEGPRYHEATRTRDNKSTHLLLAAPFAMTVKRAYLVCEISTSGSDGSNNYKYQLRNLTQAEDLAATAKGTDDEELTADTRWLLTLDQNLTIAEGDVLELQVTVNGSPTSLTGKDLIAGIEYVRA